MVLSSRQLTPDRKQIAPVPLSILPSRQEVQTHGMPCTYSGGKSKWHDGLGTDSKICEKEPSRADVWRHVALQERYELEEII